MRFGDRLARAMDEHGPLCVGIDPHRALLSNWGLDDTVAGLRTFASTCVEAFAGQVACVKPQSAFFERHGAAGVAVLEETLLALRSSGTLVILDVKRGDIGSTMAAYAEAHLGAAAPLPADAITVSPYLGFGSLQPALDLAGQHGQGVFVLALTSNPEGRAVQHARTPSGSVAADIVTGARNANQGARILGDVGLVVGATTGEAVRELQLDLVGSRAPILAPGLGAQGAQPADLHRVFGRALGQVLGSSSREVLQAGPDPARLRASARAVAQDLSQATGR